MHLLRPARSLSVRSRLSLPIVAVLIAIGGCVNGVDGPLIDETGSITVSAAIQSADIAVGLQSVSAVTLTRKDGYQGTVLLGADSLPTGVTVTFDPAALGGEATTSIMTITAASTAAVAVDTFNLRAIGTNINTDSLKIEVRVARAEIGLGSPATTLTVAQGTSGSIPLGISRANGFTGAVALLAEGLPANVTATFTPALLPNGSVSSTLILSALAGSAPGTSTITVRARSQGVPDKTIPLQFTVSPGATTGIGISASVAALSVVAGGTGQSVLNIARTGGYAGVVTIALTGLPAGVTATYSANPTTGASTTLTFSATTAAIPGTYNLQLTGTGPGAPAQTLPLVLNVTPIPGVKVSVTPGTLSIKRSGFAQAVVFMTRIANFTGDFDMSVEGLPAGVTALFSPDPVFGTATTLTLAATATAATGTYNIVVKATAGSDFGTFTVPLTVATTALRQ